ncbi:sugar:proton symporter [Luteitalea sp. TBR-22]|uniref:L-rhamnose/proton symporter RhaT n=1 Tax=Luteitalea sp. TBR-22 TaxID=2802971 RepID=UPI001AFBB0CB|nr:L-rhamnose/proton symporter RhaT [Luteitalea sp. TBR-22]BCS35011.1 sugar:proton symporter [Luteitalea sp. TBR-22]
MTPNPFLGVFLHWLGGLASGSFVVPYRFVRRWSWETYWLAGGFFSWIIMPWVMALLNTHDLLAVLGETPSSTLFYCAFFGMLWGVGNLTFGLSVRYLGVGLGMAMVLGWCAVVGTLAEPWYLGEFSEKLIVPFHGNIILLGVAACLAGVFITGLAGRTKELELPADQKLGQVVEFDFRKGVMVAAVSGVFSACFAFGLASGNPIKAITLQHGTDTIWQGLPVLVVVLAGGFVTNAAWCLYLNVRNGTGFQYASSEIRQASPPAALSAGFGEGGPVAHVPADGRKDPTPVPLVWNYVFSAAAGILWYLQFFFYSMGETQMGAYKFSSWTLHMASIIIFATIWGVLLKEWRGASPKAMRLLRLGVATLLLSTIIVGYGNYLGATP